MVATNYITLLRDYAKEQELPPPRYSPVFHPLPQRRSALCQFAALDYIGSGAIIFEARNSSTREMCRLLGHGSFSDPATAEEVPYVRLRAPFVPDMFEFVGLLFFNFNFNFICPSS